MTEALDRNTGTDTSNTVRRWTAQEIADRLNTSKRLVLRDLIPWLEARGVLVQRGKAWFCRPADIDAALMAQGAA